MVDAPVTLQFLSRNITTNQANITITGYSTDSQSVSPITLKRFENGVLTKTIISTGTKVNGNFHFIIVDTLVSKLTEYGFKLYNSQTQLVYSCDSVIVGDVYLINGQSNAEAASISNGTETANLKNQFIRCYGNGAMSPNFQHWQWAQGDGTAYTKGNIGQWAMQFAHQLLDTFSIPICILNGAEGGKPISYFKKDPLDTTLLNSNYGNLQYRVLHNNLAPRALIWSQGENDAAIGSSYNYYFNALNELVTHWTNDYSTLENIYIFQTSLGCTGSDSSHIPIIKSQVDVAKYNSKIQLISTNDIPHAYDNCHFTATNGYDIFANRLFNLVAVRQYKQAYFNNSTSPMPEEIYSVNDSTLMVFCKEFSDTYAISDSITQRLSSNSKSFVATKTYMHKNALVINYTNNGPNADTVKELTLLNNRNSPSPFYYNLNLMNIINFSEPITIPHSIHIDHIFNACHENEIILCLSKTGPYPASLLQIENEQSTVYSIKKNKDTLLISPGTYHFRYLTSRNELYEYVDTVLQLNWSEPIKLLEKNSIYLCEEKSHNYNLALEGNAPYKLSFTKFFVSDSIENLYSPINLKFSIGAYHFQKVSDRFGCELPLNDTIQVRYDSSEVRLTYDNNLNLLLTDYNAQIYAWKNNHGQTFYTRLGEFAPTTEGDYYLMIQIENCIYESKIIHVSQTDISTYQDNQQEVNVQIFDILGRFVRQETIRKEQINTFTPSHLFQGIYCLIFVNQENTILETRKISNY